MPDLALVAEPDEIDSADHGIDVEHDVFVRLQPPTHWVPAKLVYLGPAKPKVVLDISPWDEE